MAEKYKKEEDEEFSFTPKVKEYIAPGKEGQNQQLARGPKDFHNSSEKWRLDKEKKLEELRKEKERKEAEVGTYKIKPTKYKMKSPRKSVFASGSVSPKKSGYVDRATYHRKDSGGWNTAPVDRLPNGRGAGFGAGNPKRCVEEALPHYSIILTRLASRSFAPRSKLKKKTGQEIEEEEKRQNERKKNNEPPVGMMGSGLTPEIVFECYDKRALIYFFFAKHNADKLDLVVSIIEDYKEDLTGLLGR